ncbi:MAG TPA: sulfotransferase domain-containing protein [Pirellulaceae bacterium]|nr:sulfotransferase domain-containing protein [Pirellulaceae bacterium]
MPAPAERVAPEMNMSAQQRLPDFAVIGAQKAGSTYLLNCLRSHPDIFMPQEEISFCETSPLVGDSLVQFARHFQNAGPGQVIGVKRPNLLGTESAAERLASAIPDCKLIVILRNPVDRAVSGYFHYMATGLVPIQAAESGLARLLRGEFSPEYPREREVLEFGLYGRHLARYFLHFAEDQMRVVFLEDVQRDSGKELQNLFDFVGVFSDFVSPVQNEQPMQAPYSLTRLRIRRWLYEGSRQRPAGSVYYHAKTTWLARMQRGVARAVDRWVLGPLLGNRKPALSASLVESLRGYYAADIQQLSALVKRPLDHWLQRSEG